MKTQAWPGPTTLLGFSSRGGFVLRVAGSDRAKAFDRFILLSPFLHQDAPTHRRGSDGWLSIGLPRIVGLSILITLGITVFIHLPSLRFRLNDGVRNAHRAIRPFMASSTPAQQLEQDMRNIDRRCSP